MGGVEGLLGRFDTGQFLARKLPNFLFEPVPDFGGMKPPGPLDAVAGDPSALHLLFHLAAISPQMFGEFFEGQEFMGHRAASSEGRKRVAAA